MAQEAILSLAYGLPLLQGATAFEVSTYMLIIGHPISKYLRTFKPKNLQNLEHPENLIKSVASDQ